MPPYASRPFAARTPQVPRSRCYYLLEVQLALEGVVQERRRALRVVNARRQVGIAADRIRLVATAAAAPRQINTAAELSLHVVPGVARRIYVRRLTRGTSRAAS